MSTLLQSHEHFVASGEVTGQVRDVVVDSWRRCADGGVDPDRLNPPMDVSDEQLDALRAESPLADALPAVRDLLAEPDGGWVAALADPTGRLLWVEGDPTVRRRAERLGFVAGADWSEAAAGTNAPGTALATGAPVQVLGAEHWSRPVQALNCVAAPVRGATGEVLGVLDLTGGPSVASGMARTLVRTAVAAIESLLSERRESAARSGDLGEPAVRLSVLGQVGGVLRLESGPVRLSRRHSEILLLLAEHPQGLSAEELAVLLSEEDLSVVTVRAEISRLRRIAGPLLAQARPYRLAVRLHTDLDGVRAALQLGDVGQALASCPGPVLARSQAPGVVAVREALHDDLRAAVLASADPAVIARWTACPAGAQDWWAWRRLAAVAPAGSSRAVRARTRLAGLDRALRAD